MKHSGIIRDIRGQAMVEGAMVMLLLFTFIFAIFEAGRLIQVQQALTDAAREGARRAVAPLTQTLPGTLPDTPDIQGVVQSYLQAASISLDQPPLVEPNVPVVTGTYTTTFTRVTVSYQYHAMTLWMLGNFTFNLTGQSLMRNETSR